MIYLDWAATSPYNREILEHSLSKSMELFGNPSSQHCEGRNARTEVDSARENFRRSLFSQVPKTAPYGSIHFTASGTEADQIPIVALARKFLDTSRVRQAYVNTAERPHVLTTAIEHPAVYNQCAMLSNLGFDVDCILPDEHGIINPKTISERIRNTTEFVSVMAVNNETGAIQKIREIADRILDSTSKRSKRGDKAIWFHVDAVQALGKIPLDFLVPGVSSVAFSAHKIGGPKGIGALWCSRTIEPFLVGGGQEDNVRSGTENLFGILALSLASTAANEAMRDSEARVKSLESMLFEGIQSIQDACILPHSREMRDSRFSPYILNASFKGVSGEVLARALSDRGISVSTGSACSSKKNLKSSRVLTAMGVPALEALSSIRISIGSTTTETEVFSFIEILRDLYQRLKT